MSRTIEFGLNRADEAEIARHLRSCDTDFVPPLSGRVEVDAYAHKIVSKADRFEAWADGELVGLIAAYCNDVEHSIAFITSVSVRREWQGRGLASQLLQRCIGHVATSGFKRVELEVDRANSSAIKLYEGTGFKVDKVTDSSMMMFLNTGKGA
jgi:ribosomal protein S18 acetylase RimI-like enzyme